MWGTGSASIGKDADGGRGVEKRTKATEEQKIGWTEELKVKSAGSGELTVNDNYPTLAKRGLGWGTRG